MNVQSTYNLMNKIKRQSPWGEGVVALFDTQFLNSYLRRSIIGLYKSEVDNRPADSLLLN